MNSSELYLGTDGYKPLPLPPRGEDLYEGRQYYLSPIARLTIEEVYGLRGIPSFVECTRKKTPAQLIEIITTNLETKESKYRAETTAPKLATFRAFIKLGMVHQFTIDLEKVHSLREFYDKSHKVSDYEETDELKKPRSEKKLPDLSILDL